MINFTTFTREFGILIKSQRFSFRVFIRATRAEVLDKSLAKEPLFFVFGKMCLHNNYIILVALRGSCAYYSTQNL